MKKIPAPVVPNKTKPTNGLLVWFATIVYIALAIGLGILISL